MTRWGDMKMPVPKQLRLVARSPRGRRESTYHAINDEAADVEIAQPEAFFGSICDDAVAITED